MVIIKQDNGRAGQVRRKIRAQQGSRENKNKGHSRVSENKLRESRGSAKKKAQQGKLSENKNKGTAG